MGQLRAVNRDRVHDGTLDHRNLVLAIGHRRYVCHRCRNMGQRQNYLGYQNIVADEAMVAMIVLNKCLNLLAELGCRLKFNLYFILFVIR